MAMDGNPSYLHGGIWDRAGGFDLAEVQSRAATTFTSAV
jgi:hypothetical protein